VDQLLAGPFLGSDALRRGVLTRAQLRNESWRRLLRDVYVHQELEISPLIRAWAVALVTPQVAWSAEERQLGCTAD
jgi:hypothetical protein